MINENIVTEVSLPYLDELWPKKQKTGELYKEELVFGVHFRIKRDFTRTSWFMSPSRPQDDFETGKLNVNMTFVSLASSSPIGRRTFFAYCFEEDKLVQIPLWDSTLVYYGV